MTLDAKVVGIFLTLSGAVVLNGLILATQGLTAALTVFGVELLISGLIALAYHADQQ